jgi:hypothetical protein
MKRIIKKPDSKVIADELKYKKGQFENNARLRETLEEEQDYFCAYTEYRLNVGFARDIEHFNPTLKYQANDNYENWFAVSHRWNVTFKQDEKWATFEGKILHPTSVDLEKRLWYDESTGNYLHQTNDIYAKNLKDYLQINLDELVSERINHIQLLKVLYEDSNLENDFGFWLNNPETKRQLIQFRRAMETVFNIKL